MEITVKTNMNKQMRNAYEQYKRATASELWEVYGSYSHAKERAHNYCVQLMNSLGGWGGRIISHNSMVFSYGFEFVNPETGAVSFAYITRDYDRFAEITD